MRGTVISFDEEQGFGTIKPMQGSEAFFVHRSSIDSREVRILHEGQRVDFEVLHGRHGKQAVNVKPVELRGSPARNKEGASPRD